METELISNANKICLQLQQHQRLKFKIDKLKQTYPNIEQATKTRRP